MAGIAKDGKPFIEQEALASSVALAIEEVAMQQMLQEMAAVLR